MNASVFFNKLVLALLAGIFLSIAAQADDTVQITNGEWPPYLSENLPGHGKVTQIVTEAFSIAGVSAEYTFFSSWARALVEAEKGSRWSGSIVWAKTDEREEKFLFSDPILVLEDNFFYLKGKQFDWDTVEDLKEERIGLTRSYYYGELISAAEQRGQLNISYANTDINNFLKLLNYRVDLVGVATDVGYALIKKNLTPEQVALVTHHPKPFRTNSYHLLISRRVENADKLIEIFNAGLKTLRENGRYREILESID